MTFYVLPRSRPDSCRKRRGEYCDQLRLRCAYGDWLKTSGLPKLFINAEPGAILCGDQRELCRTWPNQKEISVKGIHFIQEDSPDEIGQALADWIPTLI